MQRDAVYEIEVAFMGQYGESNLQFKVARQLIKNYEIFEKSLLVKACFNFKKWESVSAHRYSIQLPEKIEDLVYEEIVQDIDNFNPIADEYVGPKGAQKKVQGAVAPASKAEAKKVPKAARKG